MGIITRAFDLFYKRLGPTGSDNNSVPYRGYLDEDWYDKDIILTPPNEVSSSFLNFPKDTATIRYTTTHNKNLNTTYRALPWGSHACDMLWNVTVPSWSFKEETLCQDPYNNPTPSPTPLDMITGYKNLKTPLQDSRTPIRLQPAVGGPIIETGGGGGPKLPPQIVIGGGGGPLPNPVPPSNACDNVIYRIWTVNMQCTKSFYSESLDGTKGVPSYNVTSSWMIVDSKLFKLGDPTLSASFSYLHDVTGSSPYPTYINSSYYNLATEKSRDFAYDILYPTTSISLNSASPFDGQYFDLGGGAGITRKLVKESLIAQQSAFSNLLLTRALKRRRLFFPTPYSGSGTTLGTDYWFKQNTGYRADEIFSENGGIYNIELTLKRAIGSGFDFYPDPGTFMSVFIHNVQATAPPPAYVQPGDRGWYPPENNIVKIGHGYDGGPLISFDDIQSGYKIEKFNFNVIQYGYPAQLCIEASGSLDTDAYFGIIVEDVRICKIGVTTDPRFIAPAPPIPEYPPLPQEINIIGS